MESSAFVTLAVVAAVLGCLALTRLAADVILMAALTFLVVSGILTLEQALAGFANPAIMFAASASFMTPLGYQTNLMVLGPGGYRMGDYFRLGRR